MEIAIGEIAEFDSRKFKCHPVPLDMTCCKCYFYKDSGFSCGLPLGPCMDINREDDTNVIFELVE